MGLLIGFERKGYKLNKFDVAANYHIIEVILGTQLIHVITINWESLTLVQ